MSFSCDISAIYFEVDLHTNLQPTFEIIVHQQSVSQNVLSVFSIVNYDSFEVSTHTINLRLKTFCENDYSILIHK